MSRPHQCGDTPWKEDVYSSLKIFVWSNSPKKAVRGTNCPKRWLQDLQLTSPGAEGSRGVARTILSVQGTMKPPQFPQPLTMMMTTAVTTHARVIRFVDETWDDEANRWISSSTRGASMILASGQSTRSMGFACDNWRRLKSPCVYENYRLPVDYM